MARRRLTTRRLTAAPDAFSGRNFNTPVMLNDLFPNKRFVVGEDVILLDAAQPIRGQVLGHCAEERLWIKWPTEIAQEDVSDVVPLREYEYGGTGQARLKGPAASRAAARRATPVSLDDFDDREEGGSGDDETDEVAELIFDSLPAEQDPEEDIDTEPEDSGMVTIIDVDSVCDDEYDQTSILEEALGGSEVELSGGEIDFPF